MYLRLAIIIVVISVLGATHWKAYRTGFNVSQAEVQQREAQAQQAALQAEQAARFKEQQLVAERQKTEERYVQEKRRAAVAAAGAQSELDRLRDELASAATGGSPACSNPTAAPRDHGGTRLESELLGHCATALVNLAAEADRLEAQLVGAQQYIKNVCQKR